MNAIFSIVPRPLHKLHHNIIGKCRHGTQSILLVLFLQCDTDQLWGENQCYSQEFFRLGGGGVINPFTIRLGTALMLIYTSLMLYFQLQHQSPTTPPTLSTCKCTHKRYPKLGEDLFQPNPDNPKTTARSHRRNVHTHDRKFGKGGNQHRSSTILDIGLGCSMG